MSEICPDCGSRVIKDEDEKICSRCGLVIEQFKNQYKSKKVERFGEDEVVVNFEADKILGGEIDSKEMVSNNIIRTPHGIQNQTTQTDREYYFSIKNITGILDLPDVVEDFALEIYEDLKEKNYIKDNTHARKSVVCAIILFSSREMKAVRTISDITEIIDGRRNDVINVYKEIMEELGTYQIPPDPQDYLDRYASELGIGMKYRAKIKNILNDTEEWWNNKPSRGVLGGVIYFVSENNGGRLTKGKISTTLDVSLKTVRKRFSELKKEV